MPVQPASGVETVFRRYWNADTADQATTVAGDLIRTGIAFDEAMTRLAQGRSYSGEVPTGVVHSSLERDGQEFPYTLEVPVTYEPSRPYAVRVHLHGGVTALFRWAPGDNDRTTLFGAELHVAVS